jgi:hypothetical protein
MPSNPPATPASTYVSLTAAAGRRRRIAAMALAATLALGAVACSDTDDNNKQPLNPTDVNVNQDDVLPPAQSLPGNSGVEVDGMDDEGM